MKNKLPSYLPSYSKRGKPGNNCIHIKIKSEFYSIKRFSDLQRALTAQFLLLFHPNSHSDSPMLRIPPSTPDTISGGHIPWYWELKMLGFSLHLGWIFKKKKKKKKRFMAFHSGKTLHGISQWQASAILYNPSMHPKLIPPGWVFHITKLGCQHKVQSFPALDHNFKFCVLRVRRYFPDYSSIMLISSWLQSILQS